MNLYSNFVAKRLGGKILFNFRHNLNFGASQVEQYKKDGYAVLNEVIDPNQIDEVIAYTKQMIENSNIYNEQRVVFESGQEHRVDFLKTGDKIHYFFENENLIQQNNVEAKSALNKIGHAQHDLDPFFEQFCYQSVFQEILEKCGYKNPRCVQSMYIFKNPKIGGEVGPHTDNTYLITKPLSCMGIWIALNDATIQNGCMHGVPGSNNTKTDYFMHRTEDNQGTKYIGNEPDYDISEAVCLEVKKGSIILLNGDFVHFSQHNSSDKPRHAFTLHFTEGESEGNTWIPQNWMQRGEDLPFRDYYKIVDSVSQKQWVNYLAQ